MRILHTGDIHLDSPFANLDLRRAEIRQNELRSVFSSMMTYARMNAVDLILISGDMFDNGFVTRETLALIMRELASVSCPIVISPGNHDSCGERSVWRRNTFPENVHVFTDELLSVIHFDELGADVYGYAFVDGRMDTSPIRGRVADPSRINLLCAHAELNAHNTGMACVSSKEIFDFGFDYAALGHIHNPPEPEFHGNSAIAYSGCPEGRAPDEWGIKGALVVDTVKNTPPKVRFVRFCRRHYENDILDCTGAEALSDIESRAAQYFSEKKYQDDTILTLDLVGSTSPDLIITEDILSRYSRELFSLTVRDKTKPDLDGGYLGTAPGIKGEVYRMLKAIIDDRSRSEREREIAALALRYGMTALDGEMR